MPTDEHSNVEQQSRATENLATLARRTTRTFFVPPDEEKIFLPLEETLTRLTKPFTEIGTALQANVSGLISTVSVPYTLASKSATDRHWQRIHTAERIRSLPLSNEPDEPERREREARNRAEPKMESFISSPEGRDALIRDTLGFLDILCSNEAVIGAANELLRQGTVLCWGAFEVFARDCFIAHLNANPARTMALLGDSVAKRRFDLSKVSLETLAAYNFNLSDRMGTLLSQQQDLSDVYSVKSVYQALFPDDKTLSDALNDTELRLLSLRRNLIVHQCGVVDATYAAAVRCSEQIGDRLNVSPNNLEAHIGTIIKVAASILTAISAPT